MNYPVAGKLISNIRIIMNNLEIIFILTTIALWIFVTIYWIASAKKTDEGHRSKELFSFIKLIGASLLIYFPLLTGGHIATPLYQPMLTTSILGTIFCLAGIFLMVRARQFLGKNWSGNVVLQQEHKLIKTGPYKRMRHPIYSGGLLAMLGSALVVGQIFGFLWVFFCIFGLNKKISQEEQLLTGQFPDAYPEYRKQAKRLIPFIW